MNSTNKPIKEVECSQSGQVPSAVYDSSEPLVIRGLISDWPLVKMGLKSPREAGNYLKGFYQNLPVTAAIGKPKIDGRIFYNEDYSEVPIQTLRLIEEAEKK